MKVADLTGKDLDMWVGKALGYEKQLRFTDYGEGYEEECFFFYPVRDERDNVIHASGDRWKPSTDWEQGGPIIEREKLDTAYLSRQAEWYAYRRNRSVDDHIIDAGFGPTPLIAAMRCFVASKFGAEVSDEG